MELARDIYIDLHLNPYELRTESLEEGKVIMVMLGRLEKEFTKYFNEFNDYYKKYSKSKDKDDKDDAKYWYKPNRDNAKKVLDELKKIKIACLKADKPIRNYKKSRGHLHPETKVFEIQKILTKWDVKE